MLQAADKALFLARTRLFGDLPTEDLELLAGRAGETSLAAGDTLVREGEPGDTIYVVVSGELSVVKRANGGEVLLATVRAGDVLGEIAALLGGGRTAGVRAITDAHLLFVKAKALRAVIQRSPDVALALLRVLAERLRAANDYIASMHPHTVPLARLTVESGPDEGRVFEIRARETVIGRATGNQFEDTTRCALRDDHPDVGFRHLRIFEVDGALYLDKACPDAAGFLNATPIVSAVELEDGDRIALGKTVLVFTCLR